MIIRGTIKTGAYFDSVTLMTVAQRLRAQRGVLDAAIVMGTPENKSILKSAGLLLDEFATARDADLLVVVKTKTADIADAILQNLDQHLAIQTSAAGPAQELRPRTIAGARAALPGANMAVISVAGRFAGGVARECLEQGLHVMLFSDNVPLATEIELKQYAQQKGLLVMGPDCGTAIINGVPLAFANVVPRGPVGIVAAAGTGLQEVSTLIANMGVGISQAIGTGGRDVKKDVGGITFLHGLKLLARDPATRVIVLVSKPPHETVLKKILAACKQVRKPIVAVFLGGAARLLKGSKVKACATLEQAAQTAVAVVCKRPMVSSVRAELALAKKAAARLKKGQCHLRGLFSGGTFCTEAQLICKEIIGDVYSNVPLAPELKLKNSLESVANTIIDLGEDEFTVGRPHPMIDYSLRNQRIIAEAADPQVAVILLDVVLGHGAHPAPLTDLLPALAAACAAARKGKRQVCIVASVTGTDSDPQNRRAVVEGLERAGVLIMPSNAAAARVAAQIIRGMR
jgi:succinyl-CoA synthetase alpha subunit